MDADLLNDLEELGDEEEQQYPTISSSAYSDAAHNHQNNHNGMKIPKRFDSMEQDLESLEGDEEDQDGDDDDISMRDEQQFENEEEEQEQEELNGKTIDKYLLESIKQAEDVKSIAKILSSRAIYDLLNKIEQIELRPSRQLETFGPIEDDPEYKTILSANNMIVDIDNELILIHKFVRDHYSPRFPELESLLPRTIEYIKVVKEIGNEMDMTKLDLGTKCNLPQNSVMIVSVAATTSIGRELTTKEQLKIYEACDMFIELESSKNKLMNYVQSRMNLIAPNLSAVVGSATAARLMGAAGGLSALSKIPACNILILGKTNKTNVGLSAIGMQKHVGFIFYSDLIQNLPSDFRKKGARCALACRMDVSGEATDGSAGMKIKEEIDKKFEKIVEPPSGKSVKALPVPDEPPKKRRGGKRARRMKERYGLTELRKLQNRLAFGVAEEEIGGITGETEGLGLIGGPTGRVREVTANKKVKVGLSKKYKAITGSSGATSGLSSSLAFTPVQGLELENPDAQKQKLKEINERWFSGGFKSNATSTNGNK